MSRVKPGRWTHEAGDVEELTVFVIGMSINRWWRPDAWLPVLAAMRPMLAELERDPEAGLLGHTMALGPGGPLLIQYWRSPEHLYRYASEPTATHRPAWAAYNRRARKGAGSVGIWHETYPVRAAETIYGDMPPTGLGRALGLRPITPRRDAARDRLAGPADHGEAAGVA